MNAWIGLVFGAMMISPYACAGAAPPLSCGVVSETEDWGKQDVHGSLEAFERVICRAVAVALHGPHAALAVHAYPAEAEALSALQTRQIDIVAGVTPAFTAAALHHVAFGPVIFWDSLGFLVHHDSPARTAASLAGHRVCLIEGLPAEQILRSRFPALHLLAFQEEGEMEDAFAGGSCDAVAADISMLAMIRQHLSRLNYALLGDRLTLDPLALATRQDDVRLSAIASATVQALMLGEASGVTTARAAGLRSNGDPDLDRLLGTDWASGAAFGLPRDWALQVLRATGNYAEIYERSVDLPRGLNALWLRGGLMAPLPLK